MTFKIEEKYFESIPVLARNRDLYKKIDGWYHQTIDGADLSVEFMQNKDCKWIDTGKIETLVLGSLNSV